MVPFISQIQNVYINKSEWGKGHILNTQFILLFPLEVIYIYFAYYNLSLDRVNFTFQKWLYPDIHKLYILVIVYEPYYYLCAFNNNIDLTYYHNRIYKYYKCLLFLI